MTSRELKRLDSLAYSPIFGNFNETLTGLFSLRAFRKQQMFIEKNFSAPPLFLAFSLETM